MPTPTRTRSAPPSAKSETPLSLEDLAALDAQALNELYRRAGTPTVADLDGKLRGRMLAVPSLKGRPVVELLKHFAADGPMPWQGKTFKSHGDGRGEGINRVFGNRANWYRFNTFVGPSRAGQFDAVHLDYDIEGNPFFVRPVKDEVRAIAPGLWLGIAYLHTAGKDHLGLFFGLARA